MTPRVAEIARKTRETDIRLRLALPAGWTGAFADHGGRFVAAIERGAVLGCQFHPELSGAWGAALLRRWLATT
jgi:imidazoleglycerol phosphate synthase glutamine amidotransferase subunit HisH